MKKRSILFFVILAMLAVVLSGCESADYEKAMGLYVDGNYSEARTMFLELEDYKDSAQLVKKCSYEMALEAMENGEYEKVERLLLDAGDYEDAAQMLEKLPVALLLDYLGHQGNAQYICEDPCYTVTLYMVTESVIGVKYHFESTEEAKSNGVLMDEKVIVEITPGEAEAYVHGSGKTDLTIAYFGTSKSVEEAEGRINIRTYQYGDEVDWDEYDFSGYDVKGRPLSAETNGMLNKVSDTALERAFQGVESILADLDFSVTLQDLGFSALK